MGRMVRIKLHLRRFARRHPWISVSVRSFVIFSATFGGAYGFIAGSRSEQAGYDPNTFAIGASFLFAIACLALATVSMRLRFLRRKMRKIALHNEALADRNWELQEAEERARSLFEQQGDLIVLRDAEERITFVNDAYCELTRKTRGELLGSRSGAPRPVRRHSPVSRRHQGQVSRSGRCGDADMPGVPRAVLADRAGAGPAWGPGDADAGRRQRGTHA